MPDDTSPMPAARRPWMALLLTLATQTAASMALIAPSVLAPVAAPVLGFAPQTIGVFVSAVYLTAMFSGLIGGHSIAQFGGLRLSQAAVASIALGLALAASGVATAVLVAALAIGVGYGLTNPASAQILGQHSPSDRRGLFFSIKQTGVPLGVALGGVLVPALLALGTWRTTLAILAAMVASLVLLLAPYRRGFDVTRGGLAFDWSTLLIRPLARVLVDPALRRLGFSSLCYAGMQICFLTFLVSDLKLERGLSLAGAAGVLASAQVVSVIARPFWGHISDRYVAPETLLGALGIGMGAALFAFASLPSNTSIAALLISTMLIAATVAGWNGVFYAGLMRRVACHEMGMITGGSQFLTFGGAMLSPMLFAGGVSLFANYSTTFALFSLAPLAVGVWLLIARGTAPAASQNPG